MKMHEVLRASGIRKPTSIKKGVIYVKIVMEVAAL
jgi:hypothetical protein